MEWRPIKVQPTRCTGQIKVSRHGYIFTRSQIFPAYTKSDVNEFYFSKKKESCKQFSRKTGLSSIIHDFDEHNDGFLRAMERIEWPLKNLDNLGPMYIPISNEQLQFEQIEPFLELGLFSTLSFELQLLVLKFVDAKKRDELLAGISSERQLELLNAILTSKD